VKTEPQREHQWLQKLVGEWTYESDGPTKPGQPPAKCTGTESVRSLGGFWVLADGQGEMPGGGDATMILTLGYDRTKKRYVGTWIGSMMDHLWVYEGAVDVTAKYKEIIEFKSDDHRVFTSHMLGEDGNWQTMMTVDFRRTT
jgi:hypothetical protein